MSDFDVLVGDCREVMNGLESDSVDSVVTDPPYELGFMGKKWDNSGVAYDVDLWREALRVAKPGAFLLAFGGPRTYHRLTCAIEDAGWEIRDCIMWLYGSGFPKSHNGTWGGTALKPAHEPIVVARKPLCGTVAANFERHGCGGLNVDGCRVGWASEQDAAAAAVGFADSRKRGTATQSISIGKESRGGDNTYLPNKIVGRWPANVAHDGSEEAMAGMGSAARFFYCAKASKRDRDDGCEGLEAVRCGLMEDDAYPIKTGSGNLRDTKRSNHHPTVKPTSLMRYLVRLVTPPNGLVLDPFTGSGSTGKACALEGFRFLGIEQSAEYADIARARIAACECFASLDERS